MGPGFCADGSIGDSKTLRFFDEEPDPFRCALDDESTSCAEDLLDQPATSRGFGLLPYVRRRRLHAGCVPQEEDFSVESLLHTPNGCGDVPSRPGIAEQNELGQPFKTCSDSDFGNEFSIEDIGPEENLESSFKLSETFSGDSQPVPSSPVSSDDIHGQEFRDKCALQAKLFMEKCEEEGWNVEKVSKVDTLMDKLHSHMSDMNERLAQIELYSWKHSVDTQQFLRTVFGSRPFFNVDRWQSSVDACLNTFFTYPRTSRETVPKKAFKSYVENYREKIRAKQNVPSSHEQAAQVYPTMLDAKRTNDSLLKEPTSTFIPKNVDESPTEVAVPSAPASPDKSTLESPETDTPKLFKSSSKTNSYYGMTPSTESASRDVLLGIMNAMDEFEATKKPTIFDDEFLEELDDMPILEDFGVFDLDECDPPQAKRRRDDDVSAAVVSDQPANISPPTDASMGMILSENEVTGLTPPKSDPKQCSNKEKSDTVFFSRSKDGFTDRQYVHAEITGPPVLTKYPLNAGKASDILVKRLKVDYEEDPFIQTSTGGVRKHSLLRPIKKISVEPTANACVEDPFSTCSIKKESGEADGKNGVRLSTSDNVFRATFSSLNDRVSCHLAAFDLKKSRVKWRLIRVPREKTDYSMYAKSVAADEPDPRVKKYYKTHEAPSTVIANDVENEAADRRTGIWSKNFRKTAFRCVTDRSSSFARPRLTLRGNCRRMSYEPNSLNADVQLSWNKQKELQPLEFEMIRKRVIPKWGSANPKRLRFPFEKTEGMFWPVVQPFDAINLDDMSDVATADTKNQLVCLTELTFAARQQLLCARDDQFHRKRYMEAAETEESRWLPGRFQNRVGYVRVFATQSLEDARVKDQEQQNREAAWMERLKDIETMRISKTESSSAIFQKAHQPNSLAMSEHVDFNLCDMYSKRRGKSPRDLGIPIQFFKGTRNPFTVPRDWLEVEIAYYMPASQRKDYLCSYINYCNKLTVQNEPKTKESNSHDETAQYHLNAIKAVFIHQCGRKGMGVNSLFSAEIHSKANKRLQKISSEVSSLKVSTGTLAELCELQDWEDEYWTIIWDNLASSFQDAPPVSQLKLEHFIAAAFNEAAIIHQRPAYCERFWEIVDKLVRC